MVPDFLTFLSQLWPGNWPSSYKFTYDKPKPIPIPIAKPTPSLEDQIKTGFANYGKGREVPMATASAQLAQLGQQLPHQFLPAALSLKESSGLLPGGPNQERMREYSNPVGIKVGGELIKYPSPQVAIAGGGNLGIDGSPQKGLTGTLLDSGYYKDYLNSGNLEDFFRVYTPPGGANDSLQGQINTIMTLLSLFGPEATKSSKQRR